MKSPIILTGVITALALGGLRAQKSEFDSLPTENGIAAIVESTIITHEELRKDLAPTGASAPKKS